MWTVDRPPQWVGRSQELTVLRAGAEALGRGEGSVVWVEGEPGIGKSSLVAEALAAGSDPSWEIGWGIAGAAWSWRSRRCSCGWPGAALTWPVSSNKPGS